MEFQRGLDETQSVVKTCFDDVYTAIDKATKNVQKSIRQIDIPSCWGVGVSW